MTQAVLLGRTILGLLFLTISAVSVRAAEPPAAESDNELERIPTAPSGEESAPPVSRAPAGDLLGTFYLEETPEVTAHRNDFLVPLPPPRGPDWINRLFFDARVQWSPLPDFKATYSGRLNFVAESSEPFPSHNTLRHDFREGYLTWSIGGETFLDAGRVNVRNGVGYGFNPTDFFRARAVVDPISLDPRVLRENRLGTLMVRGLQVFPNGAVTALFAPKIEEPSPLNPFNPPGFDPDFDRTNSSNRFLLKANYEIGNDFSPELLYFRNDTLWSFGANITRGIGNSITTYLEWAGGKRQRLIDEAIGYGVRTGTFPANIPRLLPGDQSAHFQNDVAAGVTYTTETKLTLVLEYDYSQAAFSGQDWRNWFAIGSAPNRPFFAPAELWYIRSYATDQQKPLAQHAIFTRAEWDDAFVPDLTLTGLASVNLYDGSLLTQVGADYKLNDNWTFGFLAAASLGARRSQHGSDPDIGTLLFSIIRYF